MEDLKRKFKMRVFQSLVVLFAVMAVTGTMFCSKVFAQPAKAQGQIVNVELSREKADVMKYGLIAAAIAFGLGAVGAGFGISQVGAAAIGAIAEKPQMMGQSLIFVALAEGLVVFGFVTALMILGKV